MDKLKEQLNKNKVAIIILIILIVLFWLYKRSGTEVEPLITTLQTDPAKQQVLGAELLVELQRLRSLNQLNVNFFDNQVFDSLKDISVAVSPQPIGRDNPFVR